MDYDLNQYRTSACLTWHTHRALVEIARALGENPDVLADKWLAEKIIKDYPQVPAHIKSQADKHEQFRVELKAKLNPNPMEK
jgi:hypothetical protein